MFAVLTYFRVYVGWARDFMTAGSLANRRTWVSDGASPLDFLECLKPMDEKNQKLRSGRTLDIKTGYGRA